MSTFYATSMEERENILNKFPGSEVKVVKVNVDKPLPLLPKEFSYELVCLSRVVPIKNIEMAIQAMVFFPVNGLVAQPIKSPKTAISIKYNLTFIQYFVFSKIKFI